MRTTNPTTGKVHPRTRPINWRFVREVPAWRQADKRIREQGFVPLGAFSSFPWTNGHPDSHRDPRIVGTTHHPDGKSIYVKLLYRRDNTTVQAMGHGAEVRRVLRETR